MSATNQLWDVLSRDEAVLRAASTVELVHAAIIHNPGEVIREVYFPLDGLISIVVLMRDGKTAEAAIAGKLEMAGMNSFMGTMESVHTQTNVQVAGTAIKLPADVLREQFDKRPETRAILLKFVQAMIAQVSQNVACNRFHPIEQRYARWLLEVRERVGRDDIGLTQEFVGQMLGVRRVTVTEVSGEFAKRGIVEIHRAKTRITNVEALLEKACECYEVLRAEYSRLHADLARSPVAV